MQNTTHIVAPTESHTDSTASEFADEFFESQASDDRTLLEIFPTTRWVFPTSKIRDSSRFDLPMSQWFDIWSVEDPTEKNELQIDGLRESVRELLDLVRYEATLISPERIILGGISQGCATAIHALFRGRLCIRGFMGFSSWLLFESEFSTAAADDTPWSLVVQRLHENYIIHATPIDIAGTPVPSDPNASAVLKTPVILSHCRDDEVVPIANGKRMSSTLEQLGLSVSWKEYDTGGHWINEPQGIDDVVGFIREIKS
jgi:lysophospholipase-2